MTGRAQVILPYIYGQHSLSKIAHTRAPHYRSNSYLLNIRIDVNFACPVYLLDQHFNRTRTSLSDCGPNHCSILVRIQYVHVGAARPKKAKKVSGY